MVTEPEVAQAVTSGRSRIDHEHPSYKWVVLSNTTLSIPLASINASIGLNPLAPGNVSYLL